MAYANAEPIFRATKGSRFDDPLKQFSTLYCAADFDTCYSETLLRENSFNGAKGQYEVAKALHDSKGLTIILADLLTLKLVDLFDSGIRDMGLDEGMVLAGYNVTQPLARELYKHPDKPDGIVYHSRFGKRDRPAVVFFDRAKPHVRLFPGMSPTPLPQLSEAFDALTQTRKIALL